MLSDDAADVGGVDEAYECEELYGVSTVMAGGVQSVVVVAVGGGADFDAVDFDAAADFVDDDFAAAVDDDVREFVDDDDDFHA